MQLLDGKLASQAIKNDLKKKVEELKKQGIVVHQRINEENALLEADEVFLTNAIHDIRWVKSYKDKTYHNIFIKQFYSNLFSAVYAEK